MVADSQVRLHQILQQCRLHGITQVELAREAGIHPEQVCRWKKARQSPRPSSIAKIDRALTRLLYRK